MVRHCGHCKKEGHYQKTCPILTSQQSSSNSNNYQLNTRKNKTIKLSAFQGSKNSFNSVPSQSLNHVRISHTTPTASNPINTLSSPPTTIPSRLFLYRDESDSPLLTSRQVSVEDTNGYLRQEGVSGVSGVSTSEKTNPRASGATTSIPILAAQTSSVNKVSNVYDGDIDYSPPSTPPASLDEQHALGITSLPLHRSSSDQISNSEEDLEHLRPSSPSSIATIQAELQEDSNNKPILDLPIEDFTVFIAHARTHKYFQGINRHEVRAVFFKYYSEVVTSPDNLEAWKKALLLPRILCTTHTHLKRSESTKQALKWLIDDDWTHFTFGYFPTRHIPDHSSDHADLRRFKRAIQLVQCGELGRAYQTLTSELTVLPATSITLETISQLQELHPARSNPNDPLFQDVPPPGNHLISGADVYKLVHRAGKSVTPGPDGLRYEHLTYLIGANRTDAERAFCDALAGILTILANSTAPSPVKKLLAGGELIGLIKDKVRPIVLPYTLRALSTKYVNNSPEIKANHATIEEIQKGSGTPGGLEKVVHTMKIAQELLPRLHLLLTDFANAFNSEHRTEILNNVKAIYPTMYPLVHGYYTHMAQLGIFSATNENTLPEIHIITSQEGSQQGDVAGTLAFNAGSYPIVKDSQALLNGTPSIAQFYVDDGNYLLDTNQVFTIIQFFMQHGPEVGLNLKPSKVKVLLSPALSSTEFDTVKDTLLELGLLPANISQHPDSNEFIPRDTYGSSILGSPIGTPEFIKKFLQEYVTKLENESQFLCDLPDKQAAYLLLKNCFSAKINHLLRTVPPEFTEPYLVQPFNELLYKILASIMGVSALTPLQTHQSSLDVKDGGLGIGIPPGVAQAAFAASLISSFRSAQHHIPTLAEEIRTSTSAIGHIKAYKDAVNYLNYKTYDSNTILALGDNNPLKLQQLFSKSLKKRQLTAFLSELEQLADTPDAAYHNARYFSCCSPESAAVLLAIPKTPEMTISSPEFQIILLRRLGLALPQILPGSRCYKCKAPLDLLGVQLVNRCKCGGHTHAAHDSFVRETVSMIKSCGLYARHEISNAFRKVDPNDNKRPDLEIRGLDMNYFADVEITDPTCNGLTLANSTTRLRGAKLGEANKVRKFNALSIASNKRFLPILVEVFGSWGPAFQRFFDTIMTHGESYRSIDKGTLVNYWRRRLAVSQQRAMASTILSRLGRINSLPHHDESNWQNVVVEQSYARF